MRRSRAAGPSLSPTERIAALERQNRELQARLGKLTQAAARNEALLEKTQRRELELLRADSLVRLLEQLIHGLRAAYRLDAVSLVLQDPHHEIRHLLEDGGAAGNALAEVRFVESLVGLAPQLAALERPWLGPYRPADHGLMVARAPALASVALIPLRRGPQLEGVVVFGSTDPARFVPGLASDFLAHLGVVAGVCLENAVNRARLVRSGLTDFLTGLHNRRYLQARLIEELARAQRARAPVACLMIDVDHFKRFNDLYGHLAGDAVLREVGRRIDAEMRASDTGARFGGDEFAIVLANVSAAGGTLVARRLLEAVRDSPIRVAEGIAETATLSIGVAAAVPGPDVRDFKALAERLMAQADAALYRAKSGGRNAVAESQATVA